MLPFCMYVCIYRFTEFCVDEPQSTSDLSVLINDYLKNESPSTALVKGIVEYVGTYVCDCPREKVPKVSIIDFEV